MRLSRLVVLPAFVLGTYGFWACGGSSSDGITAGAGEGGPGDPDAANGSDAPSGSDSGHLSPEAGGTLPTGAPCKQDQECQSLGCGYDGKCAAGRSCTQHNGGDTCGPEGKDSCCTAIPVPKPDGAFTLDKFNVTAGRMRVFVDKTKGDIRGYVQANRPAWFDPAWDTFLPNKMDDGTVVNGENHVFPAGQGQDGVYQQLGPIHYGAVEEGGNRGCYTAEVGNARTYRLPDDVNTRLFNDVQQYPQDVLDQKPQQCTTFFMFAAFCIWDGGRMPTLAELDYAWDKGQPAQYTYPWGKTPVPAGWDNPYPFDPTGKGFGAKQPPAGDPTMANYRYNFWMPANIQCIDDDPAKCDYSVYIAPPGRFPKGNGPFGHADQAGNVYNLAMPPNPTPKGTPPTQVLAGLARTGAYDGHQIPNQHPVPGFRQWEATNKYLAVGARCAR